MSPDLPVPRAAQEGGAVWLHPQPAVVLVSARRPTPNGSCLVYRPSPCWPTAPPPFLFLSPPLRAPNPLAQPNMSRGHSALATLNPHLPLSFLSTLPNLGIWSDFWLHFGMRHIDQSSVLPLN